VVRTLDTEGEAQKGVFLSYSRDSAARVKELVTDIELLGCDVWLDDGIAGGHPWWNAILDQIRRCDIFVFVLEKGSLESVACRRELEYATALSKPILPIRIADDFIESNLPPSLARIQFVDYRTRDKASARKLREAFRRVPPAPPLPDPMPREPSPPISHAVGLRAEITGDTPLSYERQSTILVELNKMLRAPATAKEARSLMEAMLERRDLLAVISEDINATLEELDGKAKPFAVQSFVTPDPGSSPPPTPSPKVSRKQRVRTALVAAVASGAAAFLVTVNDPYPPPNAELLAAAVAGTGGLFAGALAGRLTLIALGAAAGWVLFVMADPQRGHLAGTILGVPAGAVFMGLVPIVLRRRRNKNR
jgi:hypothetical protein